MSHGIVVDDKRNGNRYATKKEYFDAKVHEFVRDLKPSESVLTYKHRKAGSSVKPAEATTATEPVDQTDSVPTPSPENPQVQPAPKPQKPNRRDN